MENLVADLSYCKQFVELNIKFDSYFMWVKYKMWKKPKIWISDMNEMLKVTCLSGEREYSYPAPTASEIMEKLPRVLHDKGKAYYLRIEPEFENNGWACQYSIITGQTLYFEEKKKLKNALSLMLCFLIKEKLIN